MNKVEEKEKTKSFCDHKEIGKQLGYYFTDSSVGGNNPFFSEKAAIVIQTLRRFIEDEEQKRGLYLLQTPLMSRTDFLKKSGHLNHYNDLIFNTKNINGSELSLRPVTCPFHFAYFNHTKHSYAELPIGYYETTYIFRKCKKGEQNGLYRTQFFTIGDSHIFCRKNQISNEINRSIDYIICLCKSLGITDNIKFVLSSGISKKGELLGKENEWMEARQYLSYALSSKNIFYTENGNAAAFYGPKIDVFFKSFNRDIALFTIQLDFQLAKKFNITYTNEFNQKEYPIIIHRSSVSSYERLLGVLLEKYQGDLPFWLAPIQIKIFIITQICFNYGKDVEQKFLNNGFRVESEVISGVELSTKIREETLQKTPFIVVIGKSEMAQNNISVRFNNSNSIQKTDMESFLGELKNLIPKVDISALNSDK